MDFILLFLFVFFFKQKTAYEMRSSDWSSDVCSSDLQRCIGLSRSDQSLRKQLQIVFVIFINVLQSHVEKMHRSKIVIDLLEPIRQCDAETEGLFRAQHPGAQLGIHRGMYITLG